jgi:hypothetical protein
MSGVGPFLSENYESNRNIISHAINQYAMVISKKTKEDEKTVRQNLISYFKANRERFQSRKAKVIIKNKQGDRELKVVPFSAVLKHVQENNYHFSPSMVAYTNSDKEECINSIGTRKFIDNRAHYKGLRKKADKAGDHDLYGKFDELQNAFKIFNNAQSGAMSSEGTPITNKSGHTSLTSTTRCLTSTANLINEQFIAGNRFYNTPENTLQAITARIQVLDLKALETVMDKYKLHYPTPAEVMERVEVCSRRYWLSDRSMGIIKDFVNELSPLVLAGILYTLDLVSLFRHNQTFISGFFDKWTAIPEAKEEDKDSYLSPDNGDKYVLAASKLPRNSSGLLINSLNTSHDAAEKEYSDFISVFFKSPIPPSGLFDVVSSVRDCVLTSDTDSSIYTVDEMIDMYTDDKKKGVSLNAVLTYFIRMISVDQHQQLSANINVSKRNLQLLGMKNEFYFGGYVTTLMSKHYYASKLMCEGVVYEEPEMEVKGVHLKSSKIASTIKAFAQKLMTDTLGALENKVKLDPAETLKGVGDLERTIVEDINTGDWKWLSRTGIKSAAAYSKPDASVHFYHELWETVFSSKYGPAPELPYTGVKMSVDLGSKSKLKGWIDSIEDEDIKAKLTQFFADKGRDKLGNLIIPMERLQYILGIPEEIKQAIDYRTIIKQNLKSVYEVLNSTGLYFMNDSITRLVSDEH